DDPLVEDVADAHLAGPEIDPEDAPFPLVPGGDEAVFAGRLRPGALARAETERDPNRAFLQSILAGADLAGDPVDPVDAVQVGLRRRHEIIRSRRGWNSQTSPNQGRGKTGRRTNEPHSTLHPVRTNQP